jgi:hypothetical protein
MTREQMINNLKANTTENNNGAFAVILYKRNFYTKKVFADVITTANTFEEAKAIKNELATKFTNELKECEAQVTFVTVDALTRGYSYKFPKQS